MLKIYYGSNVCFVHPVVWRYLDYIRGPLRIDLGAPLRNPMVKTATNSDVFSTGSGFKNGELINEKMVVLAPIPSQRRAP